MSEPSSPPLRIDAALACAQRCGLDRLDAQWLLAAVLDRPRSWLLAHDEALLDPGEAQRWAAWLARRVAGEPLAYLRGQQEFYGLELAVGPDVLVPRADTETLVAWAIRVLAERPVASAPRVLDLGTGSGAVALAIARHGPAARITAVDASAAALALAAANGRALGIDIEWRLGSWFDGLADGACAPRFELIVGNPPYIAEGDPHLAALTHEPSMALVSGPDGLDALRNIIARAPGHMAVGGWLLLEHGHEQGDAVAGLMAAAGLGEVSLQRDLAGLPRCTGARKLG